VRPGPPDDRIQGHLPSKAEAAQMKVYLAYDGTGAFDFELVGVFSTEKLANAATAWPEHTIEFDVDSGIWIQRPDCQKKFHELLKKKKKK
jgi:hypothetical protein